MSIAFYVLIWALICNSYESLLSIFVLSLKPLCTLDISRVPNRRPISQPLSPLPLPNPTPTPIPLLPVELPIYANPFACFRQSGRVKREGLGYLLKVEGKCGWDGDVIERLGGGSGMLVHRPLHIKSLSLPTPPSSFFLLF